MSVSALTNRQIHPFGPRALQHPEGECTGHCGHLVVGHMMQHVRGVTLQLRGHSDGGQQVAKVLLHVPRGWVVMLGYDRLGWGLVLGYVPRRWGVGVGV